MHRGNRGFSLIELLVVVLIVAMVASIMTLSTTLIDDDRELGNEARKLASIIGTIQEEAAMQGRDFGMELMTSSYRFVEYDAFSGQWIEVIDDDLFRLRELPEAMEFDLFLEGKRIVLAPDPVEIKEPDQDKKQPTFSRSRTNYAPHIFLFSSGDITPFEITLLRPLSNSSLAMQADVLGTIRIGDEIDEV